MVSGIIWNTAGPSLSAVVSGLGWLWSWRWLPLCLGLASNADVTGAATAAAGLLASSGQALLTLPAGAIQQSIPFKKTVAEFCHWSLAQLGTKEAQALEQQPVACVDFGEEVQLEAAATGTRLDIGC